jgi:ArsR family transcriptional regulator
MDSELTANFFPEQQELAEFAKALGHPARIAILEILAAKATCICGEIVEQLPLSQSTVSQHLKVLKDAGIIQGEISGPRTCYCLSHQGVSRISELLSAFMSRMQAGTVSSGSCC